MKLLLPGAVLLAALLLPAPSAAKAADDPLQAMIDQHADAVVTVKYVLHIQMSMGGQTREDEVSGEATGVLVGADGLVVLPSRVLSPHARGPGGRQLDIKSSPSNVRVIFPGEAEEYDAILGATDSKLGLAFLRIKDLKGREVKPIAITGEADVAVGERLYGVSRLDQGFDYAPWADGVQVVGRVTKPRKLWILRGGFGEIAHPLFKADGTVAGLIVVQEGVGGGRSMAFLLPVKVAASTIERAGRQAADVLEEEGAADASPPASAEGDANGAGAGEEGEIPEAPEAPEPPEAPEAPKTPETPETPGNP